MKKWVTVVWTEQQSRSGLVPGKPAQLAADHDSAGSRVQVVVLANLTLVAMESLILFAFLVQRGEIFDSKTPIIQIFHLIVSLFLNIFALLLIL